jgi:hypothetical protein
MHNNPRGGFADKMEPVQAKHKIIGQGCSYTKVYAHKNDTGVAWKCQKTGSLGVLSMQPRVYYPVQRNRRTCRIAVEHSRESNIAEGGRGGHGGQKQGVSDVVVDVAVASMAIN